MTFSRAQKKGTCARKRSKIVKAEYKTLKQKIEVQNPQQLKIYLIHPLVIVNSKKQ